MVSIIVPCYNQGRYISETLDSIFAQTYKEWECIIVDDGSKDDSRTIANRYCNKDERFRYIYQDNSGPSVARNNGILHSSGEYILPLDADDIISDVYLEKTVSYLQQNPRCKLVYCLAEFFGARSGVLRMPDYSYEKMIWDNLLYCTGLFRREDFLKTSGYNSNMRRCLEDWDFWLTFLGPTDEVCRLDEVMFYYRAKPRSRNIFSGQESENALRQICLNHPDIYGKFYSEVLIMHDRFEQLQRDYYIVVNGHPYRIGLFLCSPVKKFKALVKRLLKRM